MFYPAYILTAVILTAAPAVFPWCSGAVILLVIRWTTLGMREVHWSRTETLCEMMNEELPLQALWNTSGPACAGLYWRAMVAGGYQYESVRKVGLNVSILRCQKDYWTRLIPTCAITQTMPTEVRFWRKLPGVYCRAFNLAFDGWRATAPICWYW